MSCICLSWYLAYFSVLFYQIGSEIMLKDPNQKTDPTKNGNDDGKNKNTVNISADDWRTTQSNMKHLTNTVKNLSTKLENVHKKGQDSDVKDDKSKTNVDNDSSKDVNFAMKKEIDELKKNQSALTSQLKAKNHHSELVKYAKDALKKNKMNVDSPTFKRILGKDTDAINQNINWYKPIYQKLNTSKAKFPKDSHHHKSKVNIGTELGKTLANGGVRDKWTTNK